MKAFRQVISVIMAVLMLFTAVPLASVSAAEEKTENYTLTLENTYNDSLTAGSSSLGQMSFFGSTEFNGCYGNQLPELARELYDSMVKQFATDKKTGEYTHTFGTAFTFKAEISNGEIVMNEELKEIATEISCAMQSAIDAFLYDHPEVFWLRITSSSYGVSASGNSSIGYTGIIDSIDITPSEIYSGASSKLSQYSSAVDASLDAITVTESRYDTLKNIHDYICGNAWYNLVNEQRVHSSEAFFIGDGGVVCEGYAKSFKVICDRLAIPCALVSGDAGGAHMWNYVQMDDGKWYLVDATWDDQKSGIMYTYFLANANTVGFDDVTISKERTERNDFSGTGIFTFTYPVLSETAYTAHVHQWESDYTVDVEPTCTEKGSKSIHCKSCSVTKSVTEVEATGHEWNAGVVDIASTCRTQGLKIYTCKNDSDHKRTEQLPLNPENHEGGTTIKNKKAETCTENGYTGDTYCKGCEVKLLSGEVIPATNHRNKEVKAGKEATCTEIGYTAGIYCPDCETWLKEREAIPAGHIDADSDKVCDRCEKDMPVSTGSCGGYFDEDGYYDGSAKFYYYADGTLEIYGEGEIGRDYDITGMGAFYDDDTIRDVIIYNGITSIDGGAFFDCDGIRNVLIPESVETIGKSYNSAFENCDLLECITILNANCSIDIESNKIPSRTVILGYPDSTAQKYAKKYDREFMNYCPHENTKVIEAVAETCHINGYTAGKVCEDCGRIASGHKPVYASHIDSNSDKICDRCEKNMPVKTGIGGGNLIYDKMAWDIGPFYYIYDGEVRYYYYADDTLEIYGEGEVGDVSHLNNYTDMYDCDAVKEIIIYHGITSIGGDAFYHCDNLASVKLPDSLTAIGEGAFSFCDNLTYIKIPSSVKEIGYAAFQDCSSLLEIFFDGTREQWESIGGFENVTSGNVRFNCPHKNQTAHPQQDPTCTEIGYTAGIYCPDCEEWLEAREEIPALSHDWGEAVTETVATCKTHGIKLYTCKNNSDHKKREQMGLNPENHEGGEYIKDAVKATCTSEGYTGDTCCKGCHVKLLSGEKIERLSHTCRTVTTKATLTENGKTESKCTACGFVESASEIYFPETIRLSSGEVTYNGKVRTPSVIVKDSQGVALVKDLDYTVTYESGRKLPGRYNVTVTFKGNYEGTKELTFTILPKAPATITASQSTSVINLKWSASAGATGYRVYQYSPSKGKYVSVASVKGVTSYRKSTSLKAGIQYSFKVKPYTKLADGTVLWGVASDAFVTATECKAPSITSVASPSKSKATVKWSNVSGETGFQLYYATSKNGTYKKVKTYGENVLAGSKTFSSSASGKTIYFKVRAYSKVNGQTIFSSWSAVKSVKLK